jgi:hypothetical protein
MYEFAPRKKMNFLWVIILLYIDRGEMRLKFKLLVKKAKKKIRLNSKYNRTRIGLNIFS